MQVLKTKKGTRYREKIYINGKAIYSPRFDRKTDAKEWKAKLISNRKESLLNGHKFENPYRPKKKCPPFEEYALSWLNGRVKNRCAFRTYEAYSSNLKRHLIPFFKSKTLDEITLQKADALSKKLQDEGHNPKGINLIFGVLKRVLIEAVREEVLEKNPLTHYKNLRPKPRGDVYWSESMIHQFLSANKEHERYLLYLVAINTGLRRGELAGLCWDRVNFETNLIEITRTRDRHGLDERLKTVSSRRYVPMNQVVRKALMAKRPKVIGMDLVFLDQQGMPFSVHHLYRDFALDQQRAGLQHKIRFHDLRHTFASQFMMKGGNIYDLQKILGHSNLELTQRYAHLAPDHLVGAINILNFESQETQNRAKTGPEAFELVRS